MDYPFKVETPFSSVQRYDYAESKCSSFFSSWLAFRREFLISLKMTCPDAYDVKEKGCFSNGNMNNLRGILENIRLTQSWIKLLYFIKKFENFGRLHHEYDPVTFRKKDESSLATIDDYILFAITLKDACKSAESLQYFSTFLKLCDAFCSMELSEINTKQKLLLIEVLEAELEMVMKLKEQLR